MRRRCPAAEPGPWLPTAACLHDPRKARRYGGRAGCDLQSCIQIRILSKLSAMKRGSIALTCAIGFLSATTSAFAAGGLREVTVDASRPTGLIRSLQGVSGTPVPGNDDHADYTAQHHQLGADFVRTHDIDCSGTGDIDGIGSN